jgi:uncharacterized membrane protein
MKKAEYIAELKRRLANFSPSEVEDAVSYCEEYFEEAGDGNDQQVIDDLGTPAQFAAQLKAEKSIRQEQQHRGYRRGSNPNSSLKNAGMIILGICALPIALPLLIAAIAVMFALVITVFALGVAGVISFASILLTGIPLMASAVTNYHTPSNAWIAAGGGLLCIGLGLLLSILFFSLIRTVLPAFTNALTRLYHKAQGGRRHEKA